MDKIQRIQELVGQLNVFRNEYYNFNKPSVSDGLYDQLFDELSNLEKETNYILSNSPTQTVGYEVKSKLQKVEHPIPLKSLAKTKSVDELQKWCGNQDVLLMLKADGLTIELFYENGELVQASTRGNGEIGEDVTHNAKVFKNIPLTIPFKGLLRIAGEAIIHRNDFDIINSKLSEEDRYATPRNLVAGSVRQLDSKICSQRNVYFYTFSILECDEVLEDSKFERFQWLNNLGFKIIPTLKLNDLEKDMSDLKTITDKWNIPIDGLVVSFDSVKYSNTLSETSHHPLHSLAFKFEDETEETILRSVEWNTTRSGQINPTAVFDTVILDNTEVSRASLFNLTFIKELQLNLINTIVVSKRNMIIPYIEENLNRRKGNYIPIPTECPSCGAKTEIRNTGTADFLYCINDDCSAKLLDKFVHFCSRDAMNIDGLSSAGIELFINQGWLRSFDDLYNLEQYKNKIIQLEGWGSKSYSKLISAIEKSRKVKMSNFIYALGIPQVGKGSSKIIAKYFKNDFQQFILACKNEFDFSNLTDFGEITSESIHKWYRDINEVAMWMYLIDEIEIEKEEEKKEVVNTDNYFNGKKVYATGSFSNYKKDEIKKLLESLGATFASGYSKSLDCLIEGSLKSSSKVDKAIKDGIPVLSEEEFMCMIGQG